MAQLVEHLSTPSLLIVMGLCVVMLCNGADWAVEGVVHLARRTGLPRIVIGATIISVGTTLPEAVVSVTAAWTGSPGLALGNGVGSIIADTGLVLGGICLVAAVPMNRFILDRTGWVNVGAATLLVAISGLSWAFMPEPKLGRWVGLVFLVLLAVYMFATYRWARQGKDMMPGGAPEDDSELKRVGRCLLLIGLGLCLVIAGAQVLVPSAAGIAHRFGVPNDVIAATMVALGTSMPELVTGIASVRKGHPEIMVGNVVGADVLNCLFVIGASAAAKSLSISHTFFIFHFPVMLLLLYSFRLFISINKEGKFSRWQGAWLLGIYLLYVVSQYALDLNMLTTGVA